jgi:hypothetical protein
MSNYRSQDFKVGYSECFVQGWEATERDAPELMLQHTLPAKETIDAETGEIWFQPSHASSWCESDIAGWRLLANAILEACDAIEQQETA